jgi:AcrR family transcriptional regulator
MASTARRGPPLTQEEIVEAALKIADADGIEAVSMRRVANDLGVGAMTLYHHVADKRELTLLMADKIGEEMIVPGEFPTHWRDALRAIAYRTRDTFVRHPWLLESIGTRPGPTPNTLRHIEQSMTAVENLDIDPDSASTMVLAVDDYTVGFVQRQSVIEEQRARGAFPPEGESFRELVASGEFPRLAAFLEDGGEMRLPPNRFEEGLEWLFDGMEAMIERSRAG